MFIKSIKKVKKTHLSFKVVNCMKNLIKIKNNYN